MKKLKRESGQALIEYALLIAAVALLVIPAMLYMANSMEELFIRTGSMVEAPPEGYTTPSLPPPYTTPVP